MSETRPPPWAEELRRRYLRGEAIQFVLHGNVFDVVIHGGRMLSLTEFLTDVLLKESRETIVVYNVATGARFASAPPDVAMLEELLPRAAEGAGARRARERAAHDRRRWRSSSNTPRRSRRRATRPSRPTPTAPRS